MATSVELIPLSVSDGTPMMAHVARPQGRRADKGIIILQEAFGVNDYILRIATRFAERGFLAIAPELFHRTAEPGFVGSYSDYPGVKPHMQALTDECLAADMQECYSWLTEQGVARQSIAALGFCVGGRASFLANTELPLAAAVSFYGGGIAESLLGRVREIRAPQLLIWGGKDVQIGRDTPRKIADALAEADKQFVEAVFTDGGHGFACDARDAYHAPSARMAWALTEAFLSEYVR